MTYTPKEILEEREKRVYFQKKLMDRFEMSLVSIRANYPGINKDNYITNEIVQTMDKIVSDIMYTSLEFKLNRSTAEGPTITMMINKDPIEIKKLMIQVEEKHPLGRFVDIDVYNPKDYSSIGRGELGYEPRHCFLCEEPAQVCARSKKHSMLEIIDHIEKAYKDYKDKKY